MTSRHRSTTQNPSMQPIRLTAVALLLLSSSAFSQAPDEQEVSVNDTRIVQIVQRLANFDYDKASEKTRDAIARYLKKNVGSDEYFDMVTKFKIKEQTPQLLQTATENAGQPVSVKAVKALLSLGAVNDLKTALAGENGAALAGVLGFASDPAAIELLTQALTSADSPPALRQLAVQGLGKAQNGQQALLDLAKAGTLPPEAELAAATALSASADPAIREQAAQHLKMPVSADQKPLPAIAELTQRTGDPTKGLAVYQRVCFTCHKVGETGFDYGPALTEIGTKLPKEALYSSIIDPNAGISFGFEGWELKLKDGTTLLGIIASETETELSVKIGPGVVTKVNSADITSRKALPTSLMPPGLQLTMNETELVDLIEYLASLKKK